MTKQLEQRIAELEQRVKQLEGGEATAYWEPKDGDEVYILSECGEALDVFYSYEYIKEHSQGNIFRTEQKAIAESKRRAVIQKIQKYRNGFMPDWSDIKQDKWAMCYDHDAKRLNLFAAACISTCLTTCNFQAVPTSKPALLSLAMNCLPCGGWRNDRKTIHPSRA